MPSDYAVPMSANYALKLQFGSNIGNSTTLTAITVTVSDTTNAYVADAGANGTCYLCPRENFGGTPLSALQTLTLQVNAKDTSGNSLPVLTLTVDLDPAAPPPPVATSIVLQSGGVVALTSTPTDPGTATVSVTS
jgi:hypothetical protein